MPTTTTTCAKLTSIRSDHSDLEVRLRTGDGDVVLREPTGRLMARALATVSSTRRAGAALVDGRDTSIQLLLDALEAADAIASAVVVQPDADPRYLLRVGTLCNHREVPLSPTDALSLLVSGHVSLEVRR